MIFKEIFKTKEDKLENYIIKCTDGCGNVYEVSFDNDTEQMFVSFVLQDKSFFTKLKEAFMFVFSGKMIYKHNIIVSKKTMEQMAHILFQKSIEWDKK